jgi:hypothetical protein
MDNSSKLTFTDKDLSVLADNLPKGTSLTHEELLKLADKLSNTPLLKLTKDELDLLTHNQLDEKFREAYAQSIKKGSDLYQELEKSFAGTLSAQYKAALASKNAQQKTRYDSNDLSKDWSPPNKGLPSGDLPESGIVGFLMRSGVEGVKIPPTSDYTILKIEGQTADKLKPLEDYAQYMRASAENENNGIILSNHIYKNYGTLFYSEAIFNSWCELINRTPAGKDKRSYEEKVRSLRYLVQFKVDNKLTAYIIEQLSSGLKPDDKDVEHGYNRPFHRWEKDTDAFHALLGNPNGEFVVRLLMDHYDALKLGVKDICTAQDATDSYHMCFTLEPRA